MSVSSAGSVNNDLAHLIVSGKPAKMYGLHVASLDIRESGHHLGEVWHSLIESVSTD
jgi:hypothetical protein